jgi:hypothetical protein
MVAAEQSLREAVRSLPTNAQRCVLEDKGAPRLARALASAPRAADRADLLGAAWDLEPMIGVQSVALTLASRVDDLAAAKRGRRAGGPADPAPPLDWLDRPAVGHAAWDEYLAERSQLIRDRAAELGSPTAVYREAYRITSSQPNDLGPLPLPESRQAKAYEIALMSQDASPSPSHDAPVAPVPSRRPESGRSHPQLTR